MPYTLPGKRNTIGKQIEEHLLKKGRSNSSTSSSSSTQSSNDISLIAGENLEIGVPVTINNSGHLIKAGSEPAIGVSKTAGVSGSSIKVGSDQNVSIPNATFTTGNRVWLVNATGGISTNLPDTDTVPFIQSLGIALNSNTLMIKIHQPQYIE